MLTRSPATQVSASSPVDTGRLAADGWVAVCRRDSLLDDCGRSVVVDGLSLAVFLSAGKVFVVDNRCPHRDVPIDQGLVDHGCVSCPWHGWRFELTTGEHLTSFGPRPGLSRYSVVIADNQVWIRLPRGGDCGALTNTALAAATG